MLLLFPLRALTHINRLIKFPSNIKVFIIMIFKKNTIFIILFIIIIIINNAYIGTLFLHAFGLQQYVLLSNGFFNDEYIGIINT